MSYASYGGWEARAGWSGRVVVRADDFTFCVVLALLLLVVCGSGCSRRRVPSGRPTGQYTGDDRDWASWGRGADGSVFASVLDAAVDGEGRRMRSIIAYEWDRGTLKLAPEIGTPETALELVWVPRRGLIWSPMGTELLLTELGSEEAVEVCNTPKGWLISVMGVSQSGRFVAVALREDSVHPPPDHDWRFGRSRYGLLDVKCGHVTWMVILRTRGARCLCEVVPSEDGAYIAVAGWENAVTVIDTAKRQMLWKGRPREELATDTVALAPSGDVVYGGGSAGCVYAMETRTGKQLWLRWATDDGRERPGQRVTSLCVSANGKYVGIGTYPYGRMYILSAKTGGLIKAHGRGGGILVTAFSPDSKYLAAFEAGRMDIVSVE